METNNNLLQFKRAIPNLITSVRMIGTLIMLFIEPLSTPFLVVYTIAGVSDVLDGWAARTLGVVSDIGSKLDSISDLLFYAVMLIRIFPVMWVVLPKGIWVCVGTMVVLRIISYSTAAIKYHRLASLHTFMNKASGFSVFFVPYVINTVAATLVCTTVCVIAMLATIEELCIHLLMKKYNPMVKTIVGNGVHSVWRYRNSN